MIGRALHRLLDAARASAAIVVIHALVGVPLTLVAAYLLVGASEDRALATQTAMVGGGVSARIGGVDAAITALVGLHGTEATELELFADRLRDHVPPIRSFGRFTRVEPEMRAWFTDLMLERGLYEFEFDDDGATDASDAPADTALAISLLEPVTPRTVGMLGTDLATVPGLAGLVDIAAAEDQGALVALPDGFFASSGALFALAPTYRGSRPPATAEERRAELDGGWWMMLDLASLIDTDAPGIALRVHAEDASGRRTTVYATEAVPRTDRYLQALFAPHTAELEYRFGLSTLSVTLSGTRGASAKALVALAAVLLIATVLMMLAAALMGSRRRREQLQADYREALYGERERSERTLHAIADAVIDLDERGVVAALNPAAARLFDTTNAQAQGRPLQELFPLIDRRRRPFVFGAAMARLAVAGLVELDVMPRVPRAGERPTIFRASLTRADSGRTSSASLILVLRDVSEPRALVRALERAANHDALTGTPNRRYFERRLDDTLARHANLAVLFIDLDGFKLVNDTCGHAAGDRLLRELTTMLSGALRSQDLLARLGGDEFAILFDDVTPAQAAALGQRVRECIQSQMFVDGEQTFPVRASLGLAHAAETDASTTAVLGAADLACFAAKDGGRNGMVVYHADDGALAERSAELASVPMIRRALDHGQFRLHAQPLGEILEGGRYGQVRAFELLLRIDAAGDGRVDSPWRVIQAAERYGMMVEIDRWVIDEACRLASRALDKMPDGVRLHVNLSGQSAADGTMFDYIVGRLSAHGVPAAALGFELTETAAIRNLGVARTLMERLQGYGCHMALDDFGAGLCSFAYLKTLPVDTLKIDGEFVKHCATDRRDRAIVDSAVTVARAMGLTTVAEFVEDEDILGVLAELGVDLAQGYHLGRPVPMDQAIEDAFGGADDPVRRAA